MAHGEGFAPADGPPNSKLLFVGEALGEREVFTGLPFSGDAGGMLGMMLRRSGIPRETVRIANVLSCRPPGSWLDGAPWQYQAINHCSQYLSHYIGEAQNAHKVIVTLGAVALRSVLGLHGDGIAVKDFHGTVHRLPSGQYVVPTFHPSHLQRGAINLLDVVRFDIDRAAEVATTGWHPRPVSIVQDPSVAWFAAWVDRYLAAAMADPAGVWLAVDCETPDKAGGRDEGELTPEDQSTTILRDNFSCHPDEGITVPHSGAYLPLIAKLLASPGIKLLWNKNYDYRRYRLNQFTCNGAWWDLMWAWHRLQSDLPRGLGFAAPFACLAAGTRVRLWDGKSRKISDLVTKRESAVLLGMDENGQPIPLKITQWFRSENPGQRWVAVNVDNGKQPIYCTPDHKIWTQDGWKFAADLSLGDAVPIPRQGNNSLIHGTILGDGHATTDGQLVFGHCDAQEGWLRAKAAAFAAVKITPTVSNGYKPGAKGWQCRAKNVGPSWRALFYKGNKKFFIPPPDDAALAVWYADDGTAGRIVSKYGTGHITYSPGISIAGFANTPAVYKWMRAMFGTAGVSTSQPGEHAEQIRLIGTAKAAFFGRIAPWLHPSMQYKIPPAYWGQYNGWMDKPQFQTGRVVSVAEWKPSKWHRRRDIRYCVEVDHPTHRYFTSGGLVSNSDYGAWKHLSRIPGRESEYAAVDGLQTTRLGHYIVGHLVSQGMWDTFERHTHQLEELALRPAYELGIQIDIPALDAFHNHLDIVCGQQLDLIKSREAAGTLKPKNGYKNRPKGPLCTVCSGTGAELGFPTAIGECVPTGAHCPSCQGTGAADPIPTAGILGRKKGKIATSKDAYIEGSIKLVERTILADTLDCPACGLCGVGKTHRCKVHGTKVSRRKQAAEAGRLDSGASAHAQPDPAPAEQVVVAPPTLVHRPTYEPRWFWHLPFNPDSPSQLLKYITETGHSPGRAKKTRKPTSNAETLRKLARSTGDPIYQHILDYRAVKKVDSTYALGVKKRIWADGRIHPEYTFKPSMARLSYINPNITNVVADKDKRQSLAAGFRRCIVASPGCRLLEIDLNGSEALDTGWYMRSPTYMRLARLGVHAYLTSHLIGKPASLSWSDDDLAAYFKELKHSYKELYDKAKRCVHGNNYGLTIYGMVENFPDVYKDLKDAKTVQDMYYGVEPKLPIWHHELRLTAKRQGYLGGHGAHPFSYKHFFFGVESLRHIDQSEYLKLKAKHSPNLQIIDGRPYKRMLGEDSKRVIAFFPQSTTAGKLIESMLNLFTPGLSTYIGDCYYGRTPLRAPIHDSLLMEVPVGKWDFVVETVMRVMQAPMPQLPCPPEWGLGPFMRTGASAKASGIAGNWQDMDEFDTPNLEQSPDAVREVMYSPEDETELEDVQDLGTIISQVAGGAQ